MKNEMPLAPGIGILGNLDKADRVFDVIRKGTEALKVGQSISDLVNNTPIINAVDETAELDKSREDGKPAKKHKVFENKKKSLDGKGEPNSSADLLNPDGRPVEDIDYNHPDDGTHEFPHRHQWDWNKKTPRQKGE